MSPYGYVIAAAVIAGGGAATWHWAPIIGPQAQMVAKDKTITVLRESLKASEEAVEARDKAIRDRDAQTADNAATAASEAAQLASMMKTTCKGAFDAGYASRRCTAGAPPAGVRDLRAIQAAGAFRPSSDLPAKPEGDR